MNTLIPHIGGVRGPADDLQVRVALDPDAQKLRIQVAAAPTQWAPEKRQRQALAFKFKGSQVLVPYLEYSRKSADGKKRSYFMLFYRENGQRRRETRSTFAKAEARAKQIAKIIETGQTNLLSYRQADHATYLACLEALKDCKAPPLLACSSYAGWIKKMGSAAAVDEALSFALSNRQLGAVSKCVPDVVAEMLAQMELDQAGERWIDDLKSRLTPSAAKWKQPVKPFTQHFTGPIHELRAPSIVGWIDKLALSPRSRNNYRIAICALAAFAKEKKYLPRTWSEMEDVKPAKKEARPILIYTPEQMSAMLKACRDNLLPFLAVQAFAGVRTREIIGDKKHPPLDWRNINLKKRHIYIPGEVAKEGTPDRIVPISDNLAAWLAPRSRRNGPVCELGNVTNALQRTAHRAKVPFLRNGARKSFISYRQAIVKDIGQVADEAGNSPQVIKANYRQPVDEEEGHRYFNIGTLQLNLALGEQAG